MSTTIKHNGWVIEFDSDESNRVFVRREDRPGDIHIKADTEGYVADIWPDSCERVEATCAAMYQDLDDMPDESDVSAQAVAN